MVIECRAHSIEPIGPTHLHRFGRLLHDVRRSLAIHVKLMSLVAADHSIEKTQNYSVHEKEKANSIPHSTNIHEQQHIYHHGYSN